MYEYPKLGRCMRSRLILFQLLLTIFSSFLTYSVFIALVSFLVNLLIICIAWKVPIVTAKLLVRAVLMKVEA